MDIKRKLAELMKTMIISYVVTGVLLLLLAFAMYKMKLDEGIVNLCIIFIYVFASLVGGFTLGKQVKEKKFLWGAIAGLLYIAIIIGASILATGELNILPKEVISALLLCLGGGMIGGMLS